jgi:chorismate mutase/prephenate dehydrogenase
MTLEQLRERLSQVDRELIALVADRQRIVAEIGAHKIQNAVPTRDYEREREVLKGARDQAAGIGLEPELAESIMRLLIRSSLTYQEESRVAAGSGGAGKRVLIIGGAGQMGAWFERFLASQGYAVQIADPRAPAEAGNAVEDWQTLEIDHDVIVVATPIQIAARVLEALAEAGCRVTSIHPMFGPDTRLLSGRHVIFVDVGHRDATADARGLFASTMAEQIEMSLEEHDRLIAYVLGLSHALNLAFFTALAASGELVPRLKEMSSTTFDAQLSVASLVAHDNPHLYYEIQALNDYGYTSLEALRAATEKVLSLVETQDEPGFVALMEAGRKYLEKRQ